MCPARDDLRGFAPGPFDLIYSRRGPTSHLPQARSLLRPGGLVAGIHTGARDEITARLTTAGFRILRNEEFKSKETLPTLTDLALFLSRMPGNPDYTAPENQAQLESLVDDTRTAGGYEIDRWWFLWVGTPA